MARRCRFGLPLVIVNAPLIPRRHGLPLPPGAPPSRGGDCGEWSPFPTVFWLTCPYLVAAVGQLEAEGWVERLTEEFRQDEELAAELDRAHQEYAAYRRELLSQLPREARVYLEQHPREARVVLHSGVGGAREFVTLKCLHAHLAHYLARAANPVGRLVADYLIRRGVDLAGDSGCRAEECNGPGAVGPEGAKEAHGAGW